MTFRRVLAMALLLATSAMAAAAPKPPKAVDIPPWFEETFLDFRDDVADAAKQGKRVMIYFGQDGCPYCHMLMEANFTQAGIVAATRERFVAVALNLWGDRETTWLDGVKRTEKALGAHLRVQFTPTLLFLDERGAVALRLDGYQPPPRFRLAIDYAAQTKPGGETFAQFLAARPTPKERAIRPEPGLFREAPLALSQAAGKPTLLVVDARVCDACAEAHDIFRRKDVQPSMNAFTAIRVDRDGTRAITQRDGTVLPEKDFARALGVTFVPTLVLLDAEGREAFRVSGYVRRFHVVSAMDYVASGAYRTEPSFQRFLQARADRERAAGREVTLW